MLSIHSQNDTVCSCVCYLRSALLNTVVLFIDGDTKSLKITTLPKNNRYYIVDLNLSQQHYGV